MRSVLIVLTLGALAIPARAQTRSAPRLRTAQAAGNVPPIVHVTTPVVFTLTQGSLSTQVQAVERAEDAATFYDYFSASSHTGFEAPHQSKVFLYRDTTTGALSLFFTHNIDRDTSGIITGSGQVHLDLSGVPAAAYVAQSDDPTIGFRAELELGIEPEGYWSYSDNTDGGVIGGLPTDVSWCITITPLLFQNVDSWVYHYASGAQIVLSETEPVTICYEPASDMDRLDVDEGNDASLSGSFDDGNAADTHVAGWTFGDGDSASATFSPGPGATHHDCDPVFHAYGDDGVYPAVLSVDDQAGGHGEASIEVHVHDLPPSAGMASAFTTGVGIVLTIPAAGDDPGSDDLEFTWDFGDGSPTVTNDHYNDGAGPDGMPSPHGTFPFSAVDSVHHAWCTPGVYVLTVTVGDDDGLSDVATATVTVLSSPSGAECNEPPACSAGPAVSVACGSAALSGQATDPDGDPLVIAWTSTCAGTIFEPSASVAAPTVRLDGACDATCTLTIAATDPLGASCTDSTTLTVRDDVAPAITTCPAATTVECGAAGNAAAHAAWLASFVATDACGAVTLAGTSSLAATCGGGSIETRTFVATDACGNAASCTSTFTIADTIPPAIAAPPATSAPCSAVPPPGTPVVSDACDAAPTVSFAQARVDGACADSYVLHRTWTATDACGNSASATQDVTVSDAIAPVLAGVPGDATVSCDAVPPPASPSATDDCDPSPSLALATIRIDGGCPGSYALHRTWTATDRCGNASTATQVVTVVDDQPPRVTPGADVVACLWPPNHRMVSFDEASFAPAITEDCSEPVTWRFAGCVSDQPENGLGDGNTEPDCVTSPDGSSILVRAERQGTVASGRHYGVAIVATDACGNSSAPTVIATILVPHDAREHLACVRSVRR